MNHHNFQFSSGYPLAAGDRYYSQDLARDFYHLYDQLGTALLAVVGRLPGVPTLIRQTIPAINATLPNNQIDLSAALAVLPFLVTIPGASWAMPPPTTTFTANLPLAWAAQTVNVTTLGASGGGTAYKLYASYSEVNGPSRTRAKASGSYNYEITPTVVFGVTTGSIPADSVLVATFTYNSGSSPITNLKMAPVASAAMFAATGLTGDSQAQVKANASPGMFTFLTGATTTPEGTATGTWYYDYQGDGSNGLITAFKVGATADIWYSALVAGTWQPWIRSSTPPILSVYIQGNNDATPASLFPGTTWANVNWEELGTSRRIGQSAPGNTKVSGVPAQITVSVSAGVPSFNVVSGGSGYPASTTIPLTLVGTCTTQWVGTATTNSGGAITGVTTTTPGAGYTSGRALLFDGFYTFADSFEGHFHATNVTFQGFSGSGPSGSVAGSANLPIVSITGPISDGVSGSVRSGPETTTSYTLATKWRRTA
jgi:hypothetical protein